MLISAKGRLSTHSRHSERSKPAVQPRGNLPVGRLDLYSLRNRPIPACRISSKLSFQRPPLRRHSHKRQNGADMGCLKPMNGPEHPEISRVLSKGSPD